MKVCGHATYRPTCPFCLRERTILQHRGQTDFSLPDLGPSLMDPTLNHQSRPEGLVSQQFQTTRLNLGDGARYNASLARHEDQWLLAYRHGWGGSHIRLAALDDGFKVVWDTVLNLRHPLCRDSREDPRLFRWQGQLWIGFCGAEVSNNRLRAHQLIVPLLDNLDTGEIIAPGYVGRQWPMEKNWAWFEWEGELFCVYTIQPHTILHFDGKDMHRFCETTRVLPWRGGHLRGGAPPVRTGDVFYHWFHGAWDGTRRTYNGGVCVFEAKPPFRIVAMTADPVLLPVDEERPGNMHSSVVFPCGAVLKDGVWHVSAGAHDHWADVHMFRQDAIDKSLVKLC